MTSSDTNVDLIINQLTEAQYLRLSAEGKIDDNQLYLVPDDNDCYRKSETSSAVEIQEAFDNIPQTGSAIFLTDDSLQISGMQSDANVIKVTHDKYRWYINNYTQQELSNYIFVLSSDVEDVFGKRIVNVADPVWDSDSANKKYVDVSISEIEQKIGQINSTLDAINGEIA